MDKELEKEIEQYNNSYQEWLKLKPSLPPKLKEIREERKVILTQSEPLSIEQDERIKVLDKLVRWLPYEYSTEDMKTKILLKEILNKLQK